MKFLVPVKTFLNKSAALWAVPLVLAAAISILACPSAPPETGEYPPEEPGRALPPAEDQSILDRIAGHLARGDFDGALALFDDIEVPEGEAGAIDLLKASVLISAGKTAEAKALVEAVSAREPRNMDALFVLSTIEGAAGREREQRAILEGIVKTDPAHVQSLNALGVIALRARSFRAAGSYFDRVLAVEAENGDALVGRAQVFRYEQKEREAEALLDRAVSLYPQWSVPLSDRARLYREAGHPNEALRDLDAAKALDSQDYWIAIDRGAVLLDLNKKPEALGEFSRAIDLDPDNFLAYVYSAGIKDDLGDYDGAEEDYAAMIRLKPEYYFAFEGLGMHKMRKKLWPEARDAFIEAYRRAPNETSYALLATVNWLRIGRSNESRQFLEQAIRGVRRETMDWYILRLFYDFAGDNDVAVRIDRERNPDIKARTLFYLAQYYDIRGNRILADKYFMQVRELNRRGIPEWRLNEWTVTERNLNVF